MKKKESRIKLDEKKAAKEKLNVKVVIMCVGSVCWLASLLHYLLAHIQTHTKDPQSDQRKTAPCVYTRKRKKRKLPSMLFQ